MVSVLKSKKGAVSGVLTTLSNAITTIIDLLPKPIKVLLFIFLITTISSILIPAFLQSYGYTCVTEQNSVQLYQVPLSAFPQKITMDLKETVRDTLGLNDFEYDADEDWISNNGQFFKIPDQCFTEVQNDTETVSGYTGFCTDCDYVSTKLFGLFQTRTEESVCIGDGYYNKHIWNSIGVYERNYCYLCSPPSGFYYNHTNALQYGWYFTIEDETLASFITTDYITNLKRQNVLKLGGVKRIQSNEEIINVQCDTNEIPKLYFFSIDLFDRTMWILLFVAFVLISFAFAWYKQTL